MIRNLRYLVAVLLATCLSSIFSLSFAVTAALPTPPVMRLGDTVKPLAYELSLTLLPHETGFDGQVTIDIELQQAQDFFWLNATRLDIKSASVTAGGTTLNATVVPGGEDFIGLHFASALPAGKARLSIAYRGNFSNNETRGLFKQQDSGEWYVFSQFEAVAARRAFPCFDEPHWKTPWTLTLNVRRSDVAVSNTPVSSEEDVGTDMKRVRFATTLPLPTYLVALGVGPFDIVDGGTAGINKTQLRYITPKGRGVEARYAAQSTPELLRLVEDYFGRPYPFPKLDSMVIPVTVAFGAMENPGLITYRSSIMLSKPEREDERFQQRYANIAAHEIAHQWFGDLVTMTWWNDLWLNESFATWMARKISSKFNPAWDAHSARQQERQHAMHTDRLASTRQIRQKVETRDDLGNSFDSITYDKGGAVLTMFETWLGEEGFRDGVRRYLKRHEFGNASAEDFFAALADADPDVAKGFSSFVEQPGVPKIAMALDCSGSKPALRMRQERFLPGGKAQQGSAQNWIAPVCVRYGGQSGDKAFCTVLRRQAQTVELPQATACPSWLLPNPHGAGYFLSALEHSDATRLVRASLQSSEAVSLLGDMALLASSGAFPIDRLLTMAASFAADERPDVVKAAVDAVTVVHPAMLDEHDQRRLASWVIRHFGQRAARLGWLPRDEDSDATRKLRGALLPLVADIGGDPALRAQARQLALDWLGGKRDADLGAMFRAVLSSAAYSGDAEVFDALTAAAIKRTDSNARNEIFKALGAFRDPALRQRAFEFALSDKVDLREADAALFNASSLPENAPALQQFVQQHFDVLKQRLPEETLARVPRWGSELCTKEERTGMQSFYAGRVATYPGGSRNLAQALETIDICVANRKVQEARLKHFLAVQKY